MKTNRAKNTNKTARTPKQPERTAASENHKPEATPSEPKAAASTVEPATEVAAKIDVGFGNQLFIRGLGDGLSWEKGTPLQCRDASTWVWSTRQAKDRVVFKLLLNDQIWAVGEDLVVEAGRRIATIPQF